MEGDEENFEAEEEIFQPCTSSEELLSEVGQEQTSKISSTSLQNEKKTGKRRHSLFDILSSARRKSKASNQRRFSVNPRITSPVKQDEVEQKVDNQIIRKLSFDDEREKLPVTFKDISKAMYRNRGGIEETECKVG